ncbi:MAG: outer membrane lipoprotein carrier protein LolA [Deltaproteobacteria bacterium CG_4_8_14_3_um_filter_45_9]|nr:MAG: outer membrane lipoprotein carrier protein LolA [Deltaproteobacteria bacterium CG03_land_8_20_14_0_80_45_14]PIX26012.1 MAG: outer membrane lipoprotein carrier protein LolA [Deltaproteobacteria bacterium CG_4_8_14_3_um_filter_45_9]
MESESERVTRMRKISLLIFSAFILFHLVFNPVAFCATGQVVLKEIQNRYEKTNDFEANFIQEYIGKVMKQPNRGEGKVYFKKRGMMRWDYTVPNQKFLSDGHTLWYYQPEEKQVLISDVSIYLKEKTPLAFLAGEGNLSRDFKLLNLNESVSQKEDNYVIELAPEEPLATLSKLTLTVDKKTYTILQADVFDGLGNVTRTRFIDIKTNVGLSSSFFQFTIPPGTDVIKMQEASAPASGGKGRNIK